MVTSVFSHMAISCSDPLAVERFYSKHFGFRRARVVQLGTEQVVYLKKDAIYLELFRATKAIADLPVSGDGPEYPAWRHLAFTVESVDEKLAEMGEEARITLGPLSFDEFIPGWRTAWLADPDGNIVEITQGYVDQEHPPAL